MSELETLLNKLLEQAPHLTREEVQQKIKEKKDRIGGGHLTDQGALYLIASDLEISLSEVQGETQTTSYEFDKLSIEEISKDDLETKFKTLKSTRTKKEILNGFLSITMMGSIFAVLLAAIKFDNLDSTFWAAVVGSILCVGYVLYYVGKKPVPRLNKQEKYYLRFYDTYNTLKKYRYRPDDQNLDKYTNKIDNLAYDIKEWTEGAPTEIASIPTTLSDNLRNKIIPIFKNNQKEEILSFVNDFEKIISFIYSKEPTEKLLKTFNDKLNSITPPEPKEVTKIKTSERKKLVGYGFFSPVAGLIVGLIMHTIDPTRVYDSWGYGLIAGIMVFIGIATVIKIKK